MPLADGYIADEQLYRSAAAVVVVFAVVAVGVDDVGVLLPSLVVLSSPFCTRPSL